VSEEFKAQTKVFEGWRDKPYKDTRGVPTIGWGFNLNDKLVKALIPVEVKQGKRPLTKEEAMPIFDRLYTRAENTARAYVGFKEFDKLPEEVKDTVTDMSYNMGGKIHGFKDMKKSILAGDSLGIALAMKDSKWFKQVGNRSKQHYLSMVNMGDYSMDSRQE